MNERVKAILLTALRLSPEERHELAQVLADNLDTDPAEAERMFGDAEEPGAGDRPPLPATDVLAKYLDT